MQSVTGSAQYEGVSLSPGIAIGPAFHLKQIDLEATKRFSFVVDNMEAELKRLDGAVQKSRQQLHTLQHAMESSKKKEAAQIFSAQHLLLSDVLFLDKVRALMTRKRVNAEHVLVLEIETVKSKFNDLHDEIFRIKSLDIQDVYYRLLRNLLEIEHVRLGAFGRLDTAVILVAEKLLPSDIVLLDKKHLLGIVLEEGSTVSHVAIITKSLGIPAITNIPGISTMVRSSTSLIVDGYDAKVIVNPSHADLSHYKRKQELGRRETAAHCVRHSRHTTDGKTIKLEINVGSLEDIDEGARLGAEGIGLLRSELFYLSRPRLPTIEEECGFYREAIGKNSGATTTIRLLDIGADKSPSYLGMQREDCSQLGTRGIRYLLENKPLFQSHAGAVVRAAKFGPIKILVPFVSLVSEMKETREIIRTICRKEQLDERTIPIGMMVEIPSTALSLSPFIPYADFFSIGTNDLAQYLFAASRENGKLEPYRNQSGALLVSLIRSICSQVSLHGKEVSVCGEIAADPETAKQLIGSGVTTLSVQPKSIPALCKLVSESSYADLKQSVDNFFCQ